jgi:lipopolysaccharide transport system ATP-binding protein
VFAVRAESLSKQYRLGQLAGAYDTLREDIVKLGEVLVRRRPWRERRETIWAVRDVSFEIGTGEVVGIVGRNGSGKTTLLKILSRITEPTEGYVDIRGRVGSLLEVGTGFHPELTGRENISLNGAILGMRRGEVQRKFDQIVEFAGVEAFVDTPVKRYSSGMFVRLAFSVAAHFEPEILLVDEVLAVGDADFQKRCIGKLDDIGRSGRTVLFVSHNMSFVTRLCERALLLDGGRLVEDGPANKVVARYLSGEYGTAAESVWPFDSAPGNEFVRLRSVRVVDRRLAVVDSVDVREPVGIELVLDVLRPSCPAFVPWLVLFNERGEHVFSAIDIDPDWRQPRQPGRYTTTAWIPENLLNEGGITVSVSLNTFTTGKSIRQAHVDTAVSFNVVDPGLGDTARGHYGGAWPGPLRPLLEWTTQFEAEPSSVVAARTIQA